jgi:uncharacterized protein (DUF1778 family)
MKDTDIRIRCTEDYKKRIKQWADKCGLTLSDYMREAAEQKAHEDFYNND